VEACTIAYQRDGTPDAAILSALTSRGERALIRTSERDVIEAILAADLIGCSISIAGKGRLAIDTGTPRSPSSERA
jgi:acetyl-CoA C-acetyltransferase